LFAAFIRQGGKKAQKEHKNMNRPKNIFPEKEWGQAEPEELGFDPKVLAEIGEHMKTAKANGILVRNGYCAAEWNFAGEPDKKIEVQSCSKSITSLVLGVAIQDGIISGLDARVKEYWPGFEAGPYTGQITFRHLITCTSGIAAPRKLSWHNNYLDPGTMPPWKENHYHPGHFYAIASALTYLYGCELREVMQKKVLSIINAQMDWGCHKYNGKMETILTREGKEVRVNAGDASTVWTAADLARIGYMYVNKGKWKEYRIISEQYVKESFTPIPFAINNWRNEEWHKNECKRNVDKSDWDFSSLAYGLAWWTDKGSNIWEMSGYGGQFCLVYPEYNVVMTKINDYRNEVIVPRSVFMPLLKKSLLE
jgi:CubicO group peptidase (beta-lactamase class C family)